MGNISVTDSSSSSQFLHDFHIEGVTIKNSDDLKNGEARIRFSGKNAGYEMIVKLKDGKKEGEGLIVRENGTLFMKLMFVNDVCVGEVIKKNERGDTVMRGRLEGGREVGLFIEYDDWGREIWRGFYQNGKRYLTVVKSEEKDGLYEERDERGDLLRVSGFDEEWRRDGVCYEYKSGKVLNEYIYEHGVEKRKVREFKGNKMRVFDENGRIVYKGRWYGDIENGFSPHPLMEGMKGFFKEMNKRGELLSVSEYDDDGILKEGKCFEFEEGNLVRECEYRKNVLIQVVREWKGDVMMEFDEREVRVYEGGFVGDMNRGYKREGEGTEYRKDGKRVLYIGGWKNGLREGMGKEYDENGEVLIDAEWINGRVTTDPLKVSVIHQVLHLTKNSTPDGSSNESGSRKGNSILAIDFGSSNSVACLLKNGQMEVVGDNSESGVYSFPSLVEYLDNRVLTATPAKKRRYNGKAKFCVSCVKRLIGLTWEEYELLEKKDIFGVEVVRGSDGYPRFVVSATGRQVTCTEVASELFRKIKGEADARNGAPIGDCYVTVPANYKDNQREAIKDAAREAGLNVKSIIIEPTAAAMSWCFDHEKELVEGENMLVFDFGGGTLDLSLLKYDGHGSFSVINTGGDPKMGGNDVDVEIAKEVSRMVEYTSKIPFNPLQTGKRAQFLAACEDIKTQLSTEMLAYIDTGDFTNDIDTTIHFTRTNLNNIVNNLFMNKINECIDRVMNHPDLTCQMVKRVFMVGGSSHLLAVREAVMRRFTKAEFTEINPETSVAEGALAIARMQAEGKSKIHETINFSFGLLVGTDVIMLLNRGTQIPCESEPITFCNGEDYPENIFSTIYQWNGTQSGQSGRVLKPMSECTQIRKYSFKNDNPLPQGQQVFDIIFRLSFGGTLEVVCIDKNTGRELNRQVYDSLIAPE